MNLDHLKPERGPLRILVIDDDEVDRMRTLRLFNQIPDKRFQITEAVTKAAGVAAIRNGSYDCVLLDFHLPDGDAMDVLNEVEAVKGEGPPIILQTVLDDEAMALETVAGGAQDYLVKGRYDSSLLLRTIRYAIQRDKLIKERNRLANELQTANTKIQTLEGLLPICSYCKKIRDKDNNDKWEHIEIYIKDRSQADFTHGICPDCMREHFPEIADKQDRMAGG
jgi:DNA-binding NarL/FixJ family response regulator